MLPGMRSRVHLRFVQAIREGGLENIAVQQPTRRPRFDCGIEGIGIDTEVESWLLERWQARVGS